MTFVILKKDISVPIRKERLSPTSKARREASQNKLVEKGGMPDRVKSRDVSIPNFKPIPPTLFIYSAPAIKAFVSSTKEFEFFVGIYLSFFIAILLQICKRKLN